MGPSSKRVEKKTSDMARSSMSRNESFWTPDWRNNHGRSAAILGLDTKLTTRDSPHNPQLRHAAVFEGVIHSPVPVVIPQIVR
uniref:Uncharacterized protein n=1 Tax=Steinernema glaseri TaxID=37863 RepID=A0A1I7ZL25_9BILA